MRDGVPYTKVATIHMKSKRTGKYCSYASGEVKCNETDKTKLGTKFHMQPVFVVSNSENRMGRVRWTMRAAEIVSGVDAWQELGKYYFSKQDDGSFCMSEDRTRDYCATETNDDLPGLLCNRADCNDWERYTLEYAVGNTGEFQQMGADPHLALNEAAHLASVNNYDRPTCVFNGNSFQFDVHCGTRVKRNHWSVGSEGVTRARVNCQHSTENAKPGNENNSKS